jgi:hypothetical protein
LLSVAIETTVEEKLKVALGRADWKRATTGKVSRHPVTSSQRWAGLGLFSDRLAQHVKVEREIGHQRLEPPIFLLQLPHPPQLAHVRWATLSFLA